MIKNHIALRILLSLIFLFCVATSDAKEPISAETLKILADLQADSEKRATKNNPAEAATAPRPGETIRIDNSANGGRLTPVTRSNSFASKNAGDIEQRMRQIYAERYPTNFSMQKTMIENQLECYRYMQSYNSVQGVPANIFQEIKRQYAERYPDDYSMQKTMVAHQAESYLALQKGK